MKNNNRKENVMKLPKACTDCKRSQCPLHCEYLDARLKAQGIVNAVPIKKDTEIKMAGTY
ncbi:MAG TPA: hypothetical protein DIT25_03720 [Candidatus Moranbacteria bacterium]|nr:hypothetical protein [Candidatus Moranbacteria bacterium]